MVSKISIIRCNLFVVLGLVVCAGGRTEAAVFEAGCVYTWGISSDDAGILNGRILTDAVVRIEGIRRLGEGNGGFDISFLRDPEIGFSQTPNITSEEIPLYSYENQDPTSDRVVVFFSGVDKTNSPVWDVFRRPFVMPLADGSAMEYSSSTLELMDALGSGRSFGLGFRVTGTSDFEVRSIFLQLSIHAFGDAPAASQQRIFTLISDDFSGGLDGWRVVDQGTIGGPSAWSIDNNQLRQSGNISQANLQPSAVDMLGTHLVCEFVVGLKDYRAGVDLRAVDDDSMGLMFRYQDAQNYYRFSWDLQRLMRRLVKCRQGQFTVLAQDSIGYEIGRTYRIQAACQGKDLAITIDGMEIFRVEDDELSEGTVAMYCCAQQGVTFDRFRLEGVGEHEGRWMAPIATDVANAGQALTLSLGSGDEPVDTSYWAENIPQGAILSGNRFIWTPTSDQGGTHHVRFMAEAGGIFDSQTTAIDVEWPNHAPQIEPIGNRTITPGRTLTFPIRATDADGDAIRIFCSRLPLGAELTLDRFEWRPEPEQVGIYWIIFIATDGKAGDIERILVKVVPNRAPVFLEIGEQTVDVGQLLSFDIPVSDPEGDAVDVQIADGPVGARIDHGRFEWRPDFSQVGYYEIRVVASDGLVQTDTMVKVTVFPANRPPVFDWLPKTLSASIGRLTTFPVSARDPDGDPVWISCDTLPTGAIFSDNTFSWLPGSIQSGIFRIEFVAHDGRSSVSRIVEIRVF